MGHIAQPSKVKFWFSFYIFVFPFQYYISHSCLQDSELMVAAWHHNKYGRNFCIGQTTIRLKDFCFGEPFARWYKLEQSERESYNPCFMMMWTVNWKFSCIFITTSTKNEFRNNHRWNFFRTVLYYNKTWRILYILFFIRHSRFCIMYMLIW